MADWEELAGVPALSLGVFGAVGETTIPVERILKHILVAIQMDFVRPQESIFFV